jgi:hypothetical protein
MSDIPDDDDVEPVPHRPHVDGALMLSFGPVHPGREALAVATFTEISRYLGKLLADELISSFQPFFFAEGAQNGVIGFFLIEGHRDRLDALRRDGSFTRLVLRSGAATQNMRLQTLVAGSEAGRLVNLYREVRAELGLIT